MEIKIYNSLTNKLEIFKPIKNNEVSIYVCGSTVYDSPHLGNLRPIITFDVLVRLFKYLNYKVTYVSNYTDVDDKIINKAIKENVSEMDIANKYIKEIEDIRKGVNAIEPNYKPRVTEYMSKIIDYVNNLVNSNHAYKLNNDVYFKVDSIPNYGELSKINIDELKVGARIESNLNKESPLDFALWKETKDKGIKWPSPWGEGRPGWHTECCVMIDSIFPNGIIDIHGGGFDLKFPHHENEIAQNKASHNNKLANYWMHNGFVTFDDNKMSKSLGNVILAKDAIKEHGGNVVRLAMLSSHYRAPVKFNQDTLKMAKAELSRITDSYSKLAVLLQTKDIDLNNINKGDITPFVSSLADDLNVSNALTYLYETLKNVNNLLRDKNADINKLKEAYKSISDMLYLLGLKIEYPILTNEDKNLLKEYQESRINKDYQKSDLLRKQLINRHLL